MNGGEHRGESARSAEAVEDDRGTPKFELGLTNATATASTDRSVPAAEPAQLIRRTPVRKRAFDLVVGLPLALLLTPLMLLLAIGSLVTYRAWPLFSHQRLGQGGRLFRFVKIRTMPTHAPKYLPKHDLHQVEINGWGRLLRHFHMDELPQVWLVVAGSMSLVGPRPEMPDLSASFDQHFVRERLTVLPGCTGLWQISAASAGLIGDAPEYDLHYVHNWTLRLDLWTLLRTSRELVGGTTINSLQQVPAWTGARPSAAC